MNRSTPIVKIGQFRPEDPDSLRRALSLLESSAQAKSQHDEQRPIYTLTTKQKGTYSARAWEIARMDTSTGNCAVVLPDPMTVLNAWIGVKFAAGVTNNTVTVTAINATIDGAPSYALNIARELVFFYATTDGWERGSTL